MFDDRALITLSALALAIILAGLAGVMSGPAPEPVSPEAFRPMLAPPPAGWPHR